MTVRVAPIRTADIPSVAAFLHDHLNTRVSAEAWARCLELPWPVDAPNHGFMLVDDAIGLTGVYLAFYADRQIAGRRERFCNLGAWCVVPSHRRHSLRLLTALLAQDGYHFTDLSPSGNVVPLNRRLKFEYLDTATALIPNLPWPTRPRRFVISGDPGTIESTLTGQQLALYHDHVRAAAARHLVIVDGDEWCYVVFRKDRRKNLPVFVSFLHVSNPDLFRRALRPVVRHLLFHHRALASIAELRVVEHRPRWSVIFDDNRRKMFRSPTLQPANVDYLYSELVCVAW
jgi:hypothetical protein